MNLEEIYQNVIAGQAPAVEAGVQAALAEGAAADVVLKQALIPAMDEVGKRFEEGDFFVPEMLIAARAMQAGLAILKPQLVEVGIEAAGTVAIGTVSGDLHDIGKNLVAMMLEGAGFEIVDCGIDVPPEKFLEAVKEKGANLICMSALLTTTMPSMKTTVEAVKEAGVGDKVRTMIGGAPVTQSYADQIGADGYAPDAASAADKAKELVAELK